MFQRDQKRYQSIPLPMGGAYDQLVMKAPRKLKEDVSKNFPYIFLEKKHNRDKLESMYENNTQTALGGTEHTIVTDTNNIIH